MLQILINQPKVDDWDLAFFSDFGLCTKVSELVHGNKAQSYVMSIFRSEDDDPLYSSVVAGGSFTLSLTDPMQDVLGAMLVAVKRYQGKLIFGDEMVSPRQAWAEIVPKSKEDPAIRSLLEKHGVLPVDVIAKLKRGSAVF
jgi:hypothetical protein